MGTAVTVTASSPIVGTINPTTLGLSFEKGDIIISDCAFCAASTGSAATELIALISRLGPAGTIRVGAASADQLNYTPTALHNSNEVGDADIQNFANFMNALPLGWKLIYAVNFKNGNPALAAAEATKVASAMGNRLMAFEIGNEPDNYSMTGVQFANSWRPFALAIRAAVPGASFVAPSVGMRKSGVTVWFTEPFMTVNSDMVSYISEHYYEDAAPNGTIAEFMADDPYLPTFGGQIKTASALYGNMPISIDETEDEYNGGGAGVSNTYSSALWSLDYLFKASQSAYGAGPITFNFHNGYCQPQGYAPIVVCGPSSTAAPEYLGLLMFSLAGTGKMIQTTVSGAANMTAYSLVNGNTMTVTLINRDSTENDNVTVSVPGTIASASYIAMTGPSLADTTAGDIKIQGASVASNGAFAPGAATALAFSAGNTTIAVPPYSAVVATIALQPGSSSGSSSGGSSSGSSQGGSSSGSSSGGNQSSVIRTVVPIAASTTFNPGSTPTEFDVQSNAGQSTIYNFKPGNGGDLLKFTDTTDPISVSSADKAAILWVNGSSAPVEWQMNGSNVQSAALIGLPTPGYTAMALGDFSGTGTSDLLWLPANGRGNPLIWFMKNTTVSNAAFISYPSVSAKAWTGDFNGDGQADILWDNGSSAPAVWEMSGTGVIGAGYIGNALPGYHIAGTGDFNGDGKSDILWAPDTPGQFPVIWLMNGLNATGVVLPYPAPSTVAWIADFNGDGSADILWDMGALPPVLWEVSASTVIAGGRVGLPLAGHHIGAVGDFYGNGMADILWVPNQPNQFSVIWAMKGFQATGAILPYGAPSVTAMSGNFHSITAVRQANTSLLLDGVTKGSLNAGNLQQ